MKASVLEYCQTSKVNPRKIFNHKKKGENHIKRKRRWISVAKSRCGVSLAATEIFFPPPGPPPSPNGVSSLALAGIVVDRQGISIFRAAPTAGFFSWPKQLRKVFNHTCHNRALIFREVKILEICVFIHREETKDIRFHK